MSKRKPLDKAQARERRNRLLESAAAADVSLTEGVREMRAISGMTQEEFARHRGVSARVIKAIELGQGNPTVATLNRVGHFFGLEVAFVPIKRGAQTEAPTQSASLAAAPAAPSPLHAIELEIINQLTDGIVEQIKNSVRERLASQDNQADGLAPSGRKKRPHSP